ncbi:hypothetical protein BH09SUM1_BH09SUM1_00480 [soil metagenome]
MKLRIQDNSIRFRLTLKEVEELAQRGELARIARFPGVGGGGGSFRYALIVRGELAESRIASGSHELALELCDADLRDLCVPDREGVYIRREWTDAEGPHRFIAFVEKDRPGSTCIKPEQWIYDAVPGQAPETRPIPPRRGSEAGNA